VRDNSGPGAEFIVRLPAAPPAPLIAAHSRTNDQKNEPAR
jgi:hypothetical protein